MRHQPGMCFHFLTANRGRGAAWCASPGDHYCQEHSRRHRADDPAPIEQEHRLVRVDRFVVADANWARQLNIRLPDAMNQFFRNDPRRQDAVFGNPFIGPDPGVELMRPGLLPPPRAGFPEIPTHLEFAEPPPIPRLRAIAIDNQNVHTTEVSTQTNDAVQRLLAIPVETSQQSRETIFTAWNLLPGYTREEKIRVANDVDRYFHLRHCRTQPPQEPDDLYRKMIRGLVAYITQVQDNEIRTNLWRRMFEECRDAVDMCIDGHIARLANVLVGYDDAFKSPVPRGELIQNRISAISAMEVPDFEKARLATAFFDEIALPIAQRTPWLSALLE